MRNIMKFIRGLDPGAVVSSIASDVISMKNHKQLTFLVYITSVATENHEGVLKVQACDDVTPSNTTDIEFEYQTISTGDTPSAIVKAPATGMDSDNSGNPILIAVYVNASKLAASGYGYARVISAIDADDPFCTILGILTEGKDEKEISESAIV